MACDPSLCTMDHPYLLVSKFMGNSIVLQRVKFWISNMESVIWWTGLVYSSYQYFMIYLQVGEKMF